MHLSIAPKGCLARGLTTAWLCKLPWATTNVAIVDAYGLPPDALAMGAAEKLLACHVATACLRLQAWAREQIAFSATHCGWRWMHLLWSPPKSFWHSKPPQHDWVCKPGPEQTSFSATHSWEKDAEVKVEFSKLAPGSTTPTSWPWMASAV
jgi:hypothetical protein